MISHAETSLLVSLSVERMLAFMRRYGHHYPVLYAINKGSPIDLSSIKNDSIITCDAEGKDEIDPQEKFYRSLVGFKIHTKEDEDNVQKVADEIVRTFNPDAVALVMACLYAEYDDPHSVIPDTLQNEPNSFKVIHVCYWTREDPIVVITQLPFNTDGKHAESEDLPWASEEGNDRNYGLVAVGYPWIREAGKLKPKILNPYRGSGNERLT